MNQGLTITFLGTGTSQGIPVIGSQHPVCHSDNLKDKRLRVSILVQWKGKNIVVDCGPDFRQQMLANPIERLDAILFTHEHADHTAGLDDIRPFFFRQGDISVYSSQRVLDSLRQRFEYIFVSKNRYPGAPAVSAHVIDKTKSFSIEDIWVIPIEAMHNHLPVLGFRFGDFAYLTDVKTMIDEEQKKLQGLEVLVVNALREEAHYSHFNLEEALKFAADVGAKRTYFTHISHLLGFHNEVQKKLPKGVFLAYDNLKIEI